MALNVLIVPDKFKGTLTASAAADAMARGWHRARPQDSLELAPMSDGGDGFGEVVSGLLEAKTCKLTTMDAAHRPCQACWWWEPKSKTAIIESARVIGLAMLPPKKFHPFELDTFGLGAMIRAASARKAKRCIIGIGGSATNDGGFGLARALDWQFLDRAGKPIDRWTALHQLARIRAPRHLPEFAELIVAVDVQNPLLGVRGATRVFGPQKGLSAADFAEAEKNLRMLAKCANEWTSVVGNTRRKASDSRAENHPGTGAAGGLGFGLLAFLKAQLEPGFELFARFAKLEKRLQSTDLVITGEGNIDRSTFMGKGVGRIAERCGQLNIPVIALAGVVSRKGQAQRRFSQLHALTDKTTIPQATLKPAYWLERSAREAAAGWRS